MDRLVVDGQVVHDIRVTSACITVHALQAIAHDVAQFVGISGVVTHEGVVRCRKYLRITIHVLEAFTRQGGATSSRANDEALRKLVAGSPELIACALETKHRVEDVEGDHGEVMGRVCGTDYLEGCGTSGLGDTGVQNLALLGFTVGEHHVRINRSVCLPRCIKDLRRGEDCIQTEGASLIGNNRHEILTDILILDEILNEADQSHGGCDLKLA